MNRKDIKKWIDEILSKLFSKNLLFPEKNNKKLIVKHGKYSLLINEYLLNAKKAWGNLDKIKKLHVKKFKVFKKMEKTNDVEKIKQLVQDIENLEFQLQLAWGFPQDRNYHTWYNIPRCTCPKIDNREKCGTEFRIVDGNCPIHGRI
jgi:hypothetical protein